MCEPPLNSTATAAVRISTRKVAAYQIAERKKKLTDGMGKAFVSVLRVSELEIISPVPCNDDVH
jgi:hypothetical protein